FLVQPTSLDYGGAGGPHFANQIRRVTFLGCRPRYNGHPDTPVHRRTQLGHDVGQTVDVDEGAVDRESFPGLTHVLPESRVEASFVEPGHPFRIPQVGCLAETL